MNIKTALLTSLLLATVSGCTNIRSTRRNPQTGESWTVYSNTFTDDTVSYCAPPQWGGQCRAARMVSTPPAYLPSQAYAVPQQQAWPPQQQPWNPQQPWPPQQQQQPWPPQQQQQPPQQQPNPWQWLFPPAR